MNNERINNIKQLFLRLLPAQIFTVFASSLSGFVNGIITGNYLSNEAMISLGLVVPMTSIISGISTIISGGSNIICGKYMGKGQAKEINGIFSSAIIFLFLTGALLTVLVFILANPLAALFGASDEVLRSTALYIRGISLGIIPLLIVPCMMSFLQMCNKAKISLMATLVLALASIVFGLINVIVINGDIFGVGIVAFISQLAALLFLVIYLIIKKDLLVFDVKTFKKEYVVEIIKLGSPASLAGILYSLRNVYINSIALKVGGEDAVNALAILFSCGGFIDAFNIGLGNCYTMLASVFVGEKDSESLKGLTKVFIVVGEILAILRLVVIYIFGEDIVIMFGADNAVIDLASTLLIYYALSAPLNIVSLSITNIYQALGKVFYSNIINVVTCIIAPISCCVILSKFININGVWSCYYASEIIIQIFMFLVACFKKKKLVKKYEELMDFDSTFSLDNKIIISIKEMEEVVNISKNIENFCIQNKIDKRRSMLAALCTEEMAGNIIEHGFDKDNIENTIDIFVSTDNDEVLIRIKDNCIPFDPHSKLQQYNNDDVTKNVGIKLVSKMAKEMNYQTTFGLNVLTIKL